jgi:hypothetical protein
MPGDARGVMHSPLWRAGALQLVEPVEQDVGAGQHAGRAARRQLDFGGSAPETSHALAPAFRRALSACREQQGVSLNQLVVQIRSSSLTGVGIHMTMWDLKRSHA